VKRCKLLRLVVLRRLDIFLFSFGCISFLALSSDRSVVVAQLNAEGVAGSSKAGDAHEAGGSQDASAGHLVREKV
jgi:hypothetical protein